MANRVATAAGMIALAQATAMAPALAASHQRGDLRSVSARMRQIVRISTVATAVFALALGWQAEAVLALFSPELTGGAAALRWLLVGAVIAVALGPTDMVLSMAGQERAAMYLCLGALAVMVPVLPVAAWIWGDAGLAVAITAVVVVRKAIAARLIATRMGLRSDVFAPAPTVRQAR